MAETGIEPKSAIEYGGASASELFCLHCDYRSIVFTPFFDLQLSLEPHKHSLVHEEPETDDLSKLSKDVHANTKQEANMNFLKIKSELEQLSHENHVSLSAIDFEIPEGSKQMITSELYLPSPLSTCKPKLGSTKQEGSLYLEDVLFNHFREDFLNNIDNFYKCSKCEAAKKYKDGDMRFIVRKSFVLQSPEVLVLTFKRFKKSSDSIFSNYVKNGVKVIYGEKLELTPYLIKSDLQESFNYELEAVVCHNGNLKSGHYTAYAKHKILDEIGWFYFSDQYFKKIDVKDVLSNPSAFMLFYRKINQKQPKPAETIEELI